MKIILFDLGQTLEDHDVLLPGAVDLLSAIKGMRDSNNKPPFIALVSNFEDANTPEEIGPIRNKYFSILDNLKIRSFFEPVEKSVTLSTEVGVKKPHIKIFRTAVDKIEKGLSFGNVIFITENKEHIDKAGGYGMATIHFKPPGQTNGDVDSVDSLTKMIPKINEFLST
jgi:FMN phosphatase YigB (HAD superfamily)